MQQGAIGTGVQPWSSGMMEPSQGFDPGSIPGGCIFAAAALAENHRRRPFCQTGFAEVISLPSSPSSFLAVGDKKIELDIDFCFVGKIGFERWNPHTQGSGGSSWGRRRYFVVYGLGSKVVPRE